jgi:Zn-dependent protease with chaperone function
MNFFEAQDQARRATRWLVVVYVLATALIVFGVTLIVGIALFSTSVDGYRLSFGQMLAANPVPLAITALVTALFIVGASIYKTSILAGGGGQVARELGGTLVPADARDPLRRRLRNVVEEMSIASGVPVPEIYVLEEEGAINAFAAGYTPGDAAVAVTRGTLELLNRDELQGVIAHEFSHVLNGDMRLNIRMMGVLHGILILNLMGRMIVRSGHHGRLASGNRNRGGAIIMIIGLGLAILGAVGLFFARLIKAGVSRQREYLADASAVQFTRNPGGIANALKKIGGFAERSYLTAADPEEVSHMLFGAGRRFTGLFATHPPLVDRIRAIDPSFTEDDYPVVRAGEIMATDGDETVHRVAATDAPSPALADAQDLPQALVDSAGHPDPAHVAFAQELRRSIPETLYDAAHSAELALLLAIALVVDRSGSSSERQLAMVDEQMGAKRGRIVRRFHDELLKTSPAYRLPLLEITFPALKLRPEPQLEYLVRLASRLIDVDRHVDLYEYCFYRVLRTNLGHAVDPARGAGPRRASRRDLREAAINLLTVLADHGHDDDDARRNAFDAGKALFGKWAEKHTYSSKEQYSLPTLDHSLDLLLSLNGKGRQALVRAVTTVAAHDERVTTGEAELIRTICASLDVPLPPMLAPLQPQDAI